MRTEFEQRIEDEINDMPLDNQCWLWNEYCNNNCYYDDTVYTDMEFDELCYGLTPTEIIEKYGENSCVPSYYQFTMYGMEEWEGIDYVNDVVDYILDNEDDLDNIDIECLLDEYREELDALEEELEVEE